MGKLQMMPFGEFSYMAVARKDRAICNLPSFPITCFGRLSLLSDSHYLGELNTSPYAVLAALNKSLQCKALYLDT